MIPFVMGLPISCFTLLRLFYIKILSSCTSLLFWDLASQPLNTQANSQMVLESQCLVQGCWCIPKIQFYLLKELCSSFCSCPYFCSLGFLVFILFAFLANGGVSQHQSWVKIFFSWCFFRLGQCNFWGSSRNCFGPPFVFIIMSMIYRLCCEEV